MYHYKVKIAYKGTHYFGWQAQSVEIGSEEKPTAQGTIAGEKTYCSFAYWKLMFQYAKLCAPASGRNDQRKTQE